MFCDICGSPTDFDGDRHCYHCHRELLDLEGEIPLEECEDEDFEEVKA